MKSTFDELQAFVAIVDAGSITAAAESLGLPVSAVSRLLSRLEEKLETTLLSRTTRRLELTEEGSAFLTSAREIVAAVENAEDSLRVRRERPAGRLRINAATPFMLHTIVPLVAGYRERFPGVELELNSDDGFIDLLERRTDVAIRIGVLKDSSLHARALGRSRVRLLATPAYVARHGLPGGVAELDAHALLGFTQPETLNEWPVRDASGAPLSVVPTIRASSGETLRQLALAHQGIVCLSDFMTGADQREGRLVQVLADATFDLHRPVNAVYYRSAALSGRITSFLDYLVESIEAGAIAL